jgi:hypothetical protein
LGYYNLSEKLENLLLLYNSQLNFDNLITHLENNTSDSNYKDFVTNLVEHKEKKYTTALLGYNKYNSKH